MPELRIEATVNGRKVARSAKPHQRLLDFLRDDLNLTGTKEGCGAGECGTCSVFVDGVLMKSCLMPVGQGAGRDDRDRRRARARPASCRVLQKAFHKTGASQCGYCIPGMVMAATAALRANPFAGPRGDQGAARRQYLPLHRLSEDFRRGRAGPRRASTAACRRPRSPRTSRRTAASSAPMSAASMRRARCRAR